MLRSLCFRADPRGPAATTTRVRSSRSAVLLFVSGLATAGGQPATPEVPWKWEIRAVIGRSTTDNKFDPNASFKAAGYGDSYHMPAGCFIGCYAARTTPYPQRSAGGFTSGLAVTYHVSRRLAIMGQWDATSLGKAEGFRRTGEDLFEATTGTYVALVPDVASLSLIPMLVLGSHARVGVGPEINSVGIRYRDDAGETTKNQTRAGLVGVFTLTTPPWQKMIMTLAVEHHRASDAVVDPYTVHSTEAGSSEVGGSTIPLTRTAARIGVGVKW